MVKQQACYYICSDRTEEQYQGEYIEIPFLTVMHYEYLAILGERNVQLFGDYFPIRFD